MNILTFDIEDWFHILDLEETEDVNSWHKYESRLERNLEFIFTILLKVDIKQPFLYWAGLQRSIPK